MKIADREIGPYCPPFIVAEMSGNHRQSLQQALRIVEAAARAGAHALKLQTYTPDTITLDAPGPDFYITDKNSLWQKNSLYSLYQEAHTPWEWHRPIFERAAELGLAVFSTPFDETAVDFLEQLQAPCYKIASFENTDLPLISKAAATGKPLIISTGMASVAELGEAVHTARAAGCRDLLLLKCTSAYPARPEDSNILTIPHMRSLFNCEVGLSDHTPGLGAALAAVAVGASFIEKHFTLSRAQGGVDAAFSMEPQEMEQLVLESEQAWRSLGTVQYGPGERERGSLQFRRSLYVAEDMKAGDLFTKKNLRIIRPGYGLEPKYYDIFLGRPAKRDLLKGLRLSWDMI